MKINYLINRILHTQFSLIFILILGIINLFLLVRYLNISEYSQWVVIQGIINLCGLLFAQNLFIYTRLHIPGNVAEVQYGYFFTSLLCILSFYILFVIFAHSFGFDSYILSTFKVDIKLVNLILIIILFDLLVKELVRFYTAKKDIYYKNYILVANKALVVICVLYLIYFNDINLYSYLISLLLAQVFTVLIALIKFDFRIFNKINIMRDVLTKGYHIAIYMFPIGVLGLAINYTDTFMIAHKFSATDVAQYGLASQLTLASMTIIGGTIVLTIFPYATEAVNKHSTEEAADYVIKMYKYCIIVSVFYYLATILLGTFIVKMFVSKSYKYTKSLDYFYILNSFTIFHSVYVVNGHYLQLLRIFKPQSILSLFIIILNVVLNYILLRVIGVIGAAIASLISYSLLAFSYTYIVYKHDDFVINRIKKNLSET